MNESVETQSQEIKASKKNSWTRNIVKDFDAPQNYSPRAIWLFSAFFAVIFGL